MADSVSRDEARVLAQASVAIARRFAAGATMWCVAPDYLDHGQHVAVEFIHPVIVGKRALPAACIEGTDPVTRLRLLAKPGDIVVTIGDSNDPCLVEVLKRSDPWGLTSIWIGAATPSQEKPPADFSVAVSTEDMATASLSGEVVLRYHLLWELVHVVFEHPGLLTEKKACEDDVCITCSDEGRVAEVLRADDYEAEVLAGGRRETVDLSLIEDVEVGDMVLVHAGVAISLLEGAAR